MENQLKATELKKELRVGNYVLFRGQIKTVYQIRNSGCDFSIGGNAYQSYVWESIQSIPLTEDILVKLGFEKKENSILEKSGLRLFAIRDLYFRANFPISADVKFVHQLQNLFFALTGEELTFKK